MPPTSEILNRFHQVLLQEISESRPEYLTQPFTVAEIYQNLVPYRSHRDLIGVEMNGDYKDALLRLLAGEGDYLLLDSEVARREIREELESPNPNTGLFRDFAAADVRLNPDRVLTGAGEVSGESPDEALEEEDAASPDEMGAEGLEAIDIAELMPDEDDTDEEDDGDAGESGDDGVIGHIELADDGVPVPGTEPEHEDARSDDPPDISSLEETPDPVAVEPEEPEEPGEDADPVAAADGGPAACHWCRQILPHRKALNFCPFCGSDLRLFPCPKCGEELEPRWQFCVSCGNEVSE